MNGEIVSKSSILGMASQGPRVKSNVGHGKARLIKSGLEDLPSVPRVFHLLQHIERIPM